MPKGVPLLFWALSGIRDSCCNAAALSIAGDTECGCRVEPLVARAPLGAESMRRYRRAASALQFPQSGRTSIVPVRASPRPRDRVFGRDLDCLVQAAALDDVEPADGLLSLDERAVGDDRLPVADADGAGRGFTNYATWAGVGKSLAADPWRCA